MPINKKDVFRFFLIPIATILTLLFSLNAFCAEDIYSLTSEMQKAQLKYDLAAKNGDKTEAENLRNKLEELRFSLSTLKEKKMNEEINSQLKSAKGRLLEPVVPLLPSLPAAHNSEAAYRHYGHQYNVVSVIIEAKMPLLIARIDALRKKYDKDFSGFIKNLQSENLINAQSSRIAENYALTDLPREINENTISGLEDIVSGHKSAKGAIVFYNKVISDVKSAINELAPFKDRVIEIAMLENELEGLLKLADSLIDMRSRIAGEYGAGSAEQISVLINKLTPKNFDIHAKSINNIAIIARMDELLARYHKLIPAAIETLRKNIEVYERAFPAVSGLYYKKFKKLTQDLENSNKALNRMESAGREYDKLLLASHWLDERLIQPYEYYYSAAKKGLTKNISYVFSRESFVSELEKTLEKENLRKFEAALTKYHKLLERYYALDKEYASNWNNYYHYLKEAESGIGPYIRDLKRASEISGAYLKVASPDIKRERGLELKTMLFNNVWKDAPNLPKIDLDLESLAVYKLYEIKKAIRREGRGWFFLEQNLFYKKIEEMIAQLDEIGREQKYASIVKTIKNEIGALAGQEKSANAHRIENEK